MIQLKKQTPAAVKTSLQIFEALNSQEIRYCHWKSKAHLASSFNSEADFDLLVDEEHEKQFHQLMREYRFKRRHATADKTYPGIEDFLGFDHESGRLIHLHVHFKLIFGQKHRKNFRLPIEVEILNTAIWDDVYPIKISRPELEFLMLLVRAIIKVDFRPKAFARRLVRRLGAFPPNVLQEYEFLKARIDCHKFDEDVHKLFPELHAVFALLIRRGLTDLSYARIRLLQRRILRSLKRYQIFTKKELRMDMFVRRLSLKQTRAWLGSGGMTVAFVGSDGAGKSSTVLEIKKWLGWKLSVKAMYMGLPKKSAAWQTLTLLTRAASRLNFTNKFDALRWVHVAKVRRAINLRGERLKNQGYVVLYDRFPLKEFWDMQEPMDGPRLQNGSRQKERERTIYDSVRLPDYIFLLRVDADSAVSRKGELSDSRKREQVEAKIAAVDKLAETKNPRFIVVDTTQGREQTLLHIKRKLWDIM